MGYVNSGISAAPGLLRGEAKAGKLQAPAPPACDHHPHAVAVRVEHVGVRAAQGFFQRISLTMPGNGELLLPWTASPGWRPDASSSKGVGGACSLGMPSYRK